MKRGIGIDVLTAARQRLDRVFTDFERVYVSFSGGKDSGVLVQLAEEAARKANRLPLDVLIIDLEGQYQHTIDFIERIASRPGIRAHWVCLPLNLRNSVSQYQPFWMCWDPDAQERWVRPLPKHPSVIEDEKHFPFFRRGMEFEEFTPEFLRWFSNSRNTACLVGIRTDESLNRMRTIMSTSKTPWYGLQWTTQVNETGYNAYPLYDWRTEDIWTATQKLALDRNRIYDLMHLAGLSPSQMRLCQPYGDDQRKGLWLFKILEPDTWARVVARVDGVNFGERHSSDKSMGRLKVDLPEGHTWQSFAALLLQTMPPHLSSHYCKKIDVFLKWWAKNGFSDGIPDEADQKLEAQKKTPSWRRIVKVLMKNDFWAKGLSFAPTKREHERQLMNALRFVEGA